MKQVLRRALQEAATRLDLPRYLPSPRSGAGLAKLPHNAACAYFYGDHIARHAGVRNAQFLLGHAGIATTEIYVGQPTLEELAGAVSGFSYGIATRTNVPGASQEAETADKATTGIEPV